MNHARYSFPSSSCILPEVVVEPAQQHLLDRELEELLLRLALLHQVNQVRASLPTTKPNHTNKTSKKNIAEFVQLIQLKYIGEAHNRGATATGAQTHAFDPDSSPQRARPCRKPSSDGRSCPRRILQTCPVLSKQYQLLSCSQLYCVSLAKVATTINMITAFPAEITMFSKPRYFYFYLHDCSLNLLSFLPHTLRLICARRCTRISCHERPRMLAGRPSIMSRAPILTTCKPAASAAVRAALRFSVDLYRPKGSAPGGTLTLASAVAGDGGRGGVVVGCT